MATRACRAPGVVELSRWYAVLRGPGCHDPMMIGRRSAQAGNDVLHDVCGRFHPNRLEGGVVVIGEPGFGCVSVRELDAHGGVFHRPRHDVRWAGEVITRNAVIPPSYRSGMELEALQALAWHRSIETTRLYVHLANDWLADEYDRATVAIDADVFLAAADGIGR